MCWTHALQVALPSCNRNSLALRTKLVLPTKLAFWCGWPAVHAVLASSWPSSSAIHDGVSSISGICLHSMSSISYRLETDFVTLFRCPSRASRNMMTTTRREPRTCDDQHCALEQDNVVYCDHDRMSTAIAAATFVNEATGRASLVIILRMIISHLVLSQWRSGSCGGPSNPKLKNTPKSSSRADKMSCAVPAARYNVKSWSRDVSQHCKEHPGATEG